jgi:hypothetical protein
MLLNLLVSCGSPAAKDLNDKVIHIVDVGEDPPTNLTPDVDEELKPYYNEFLADASARGKTLPTNLASVKLVDKISFGGQGMNGFVVGLCITYTYSNSKIINHIQIDRMLLKEKTILKTIVYHELGHCSLSLPHTPPDSMQIMDPVLSMTTSYINKNWSDLVDYEFNSAK